MKKSYLAFDLGASSGRAIVGELENGKMSLHEIHRFPNGPVGINGSLHWDFDAIMGEIKAGLHKAVTKHGEISSIGVDTWGVDYLFVKSDGTIPLPPYHYRDSRTDKAPEMVYAKVSREDLYARTGIQFMQLNTVYQLMAHRAARPEDFEDSVMLMIPDAINYALTGKKACEYTEASTSNLLDARSGNWDFGVIDALELPRSIFPPVEKPCGFAGMLQKSVCEEAGCGPIPVVHVGSHDTASAVASAPAPHGKNWAYISCGTWALLGVEADAPVLSEEARLASFTNEGGLDKKIRLLTNIMGTWLFQECRRVWTERGQKISFAEMGSLAKTAAPLKYIINPNDKMFFAPGDMPANVAAYCEKTGQGRPADKAAVLRCIYDSLALCFRYKLEGMDELLGRKTDCLNIIGGGTQDKSLMRLTADCVEIPVLAGPVEATAAGNIAAQAMTAGDIGSLSEARDIIKASFEVEEFTPDADASPAWDEALDRFKKLL
jgi:sugar (pentulose or hexulose) kinase